MPRIECVIAVNPNELMAGMNISYCLLSKVCNGLSSISRLQQCVGLLDPISRIDGMSDYKDCIVVSYV